VNSTLTGATTKLVCKLAGEDPAHRKRRATRPGPYCATCRRPIAEAASAARHDAYVVVTYELMPGEYAKLLKQQGGKCAICPEPLKYTKRRYAVDHDHARERLLGTRKSIRGLLCKRHNNLLRDVRDSIEVLENALAYLKDPPAWPVLGIEKN
jgi:hypothetical protein